MRVKKNQGYKVSAHRYGGPHAKVLKTKHIGLGETRRGMSARPVKPKSTTKLHVVLSAINKAKHLAILP
jgi:hypothetical protein